MKIDDIHEISCYNGCHIYLASILIFQVILWKLFSRFVENQSHNSGNDEWLDTLQSHKIINNAKYLGQSFHLKISPTKYVLLLDAILILLMKYIHRYIIIDEIYYFLWDITTICTSHRSRTFRIEFWKVITHLHYFQKITD